MAEAYSCRPSDIRFGPARDAHFDRLVADAAGEILGRVGKILENDTSGKKKRSQVERQVLGGYLSQARREREAAGG